MPCEFFKVPGLGSGVICSRGQRTIKCRWCARPRAYTCDQKIQGKKRPCNAPICMEHAMEVGPDEHRCPEHAPEHPPAPQGPCQVWTAKVNVYNGDDQLIVTRYLINDPLGVLFAPSKGILDRALAARKRGELEGEWPVFKEAYLREMRQFYKTNRKAFQTVLRRSEVTLLCFCPDPAFCHRTLLAGIMQKLGAEVRGEREPAQQGLF